MLDTYVDNILRAWTYASPMAHEAGASWYSEANSLACSLDADVSRAAAVIASLSPLTPWNRNKHLAILAYAQGGLSGGTLPISVNRVNRLFAGESPDTVMTSDKTRAFWQTIADPTADVTPVIDRHAYDIAMWERGTDETRKLGKRNYAALANAYTMASFWVGVAPSTMQAVTWCAWREWHGIHWAD